VGEFRAWLSAGSQILFAFRFANPLTQRFPLGEMAVPRRSMRTIEVSRSTKKWPVIGTIVGLGVGLPAAAVSVFRRAGGFLSNDHQTRANTVAFAILGGLTAGGFLVGWALDHRKTVIVVNP